MDGIVKLKYGLDARFDARRWLAVAAAFVVGAVAGGALVWGDGGGPDQAVAQPLPELDCLLEPSAVVSVSSQVPGVLESVTVERAQLVEAGDEVAALKTRVGEDTG